MILAITESTVPLNIRGLLLLLRAQSKRERKRMYGDEMLYLLVKRHYKGVDSPQDLHKALTTPRKALPKEKVIASILRKLG